MRALYISVLVLIVAALAILAYQNNESVTLQYFRRSIILPMSLLITAVYVLGMPSGRWNAHSSERQRGTDRFRKKAVPCLGSLLLWLSQQTRNDSRYVKTVVRH